MSDVVEKLKAARELIARPGGWTQGAGARDVRGFPVSCRSRSARSFCAIGAFDAVGCSVAIYILEKVIGHVGIISWNDDSDRTPTDVVAAFDRAITLAEAEGAENA